MLRFTTVLIASLALLGASSAVAPGRAGAQESDTPAAGIAPTGSISGQVTFVGGKPAVRKLVQYQPIGDKNAGNTAVTDLDGNYSFKGLADGVYLVGFFHPDRVPTTEAKNQGVISDPGASAESIAATGAAPVVKKVEVTGGAEVTGIDFTITDIGPETVEGPDVTGADLQGGTLPAAGAGQQDDRANSGLWVWLAALGCLAVAGVLGAWRLRAR